MPAWRSSISAWSRRATISMPTRLQVLRRDHHPAGQAGHHRRLDPGLHSLARRLCHAARAGRRQEHDARQPDRAAVRPGPQLAAGRRALDHADGDRHGGAAGLCPQCDRGRERGMASARHFDVRRQPGFAHDRDVLLLRCSICRSRRWSSSPSTPAIVAGGVGAASRCAGSKPPGSNAQVQEAALRSLHHRGQSPRRSPPSRRPWRRSPPPAPSPIAA